MNVRIQPSPIKKKAYRAVFTREKDGETTHTDFGSPLHQNYTQHHDEVRKKKYLTRFNKLIQQYKDNPQAPTTLSTMLLWNKPTLEKSLQDYKKYFGFKK